MVQGPLPNTGYGYVGTANIGAAHSFDYRKRAMRRLHDHYPGNWSFQEIDQDDIGNELTALETVFHDYTVIDQGYPEGSTHHVPIAARRRFWGVDPEHDAIAGHGGVEGLTRPSVILVTYHWSREFNAFYAQFNGQPVAWDGPEWRIRHRYWNDWFGNLTTYAGLLVGELGITVIVALDANRSDMPALHRNENRYVARGTSYISVIEPRPWNSSDQGVRVDLVGVNHINLDIDAQQAHRARLRFTATKPGSGPR